MLGYYNDMSKLLFIRDYTQLKLNPTVKSALDLTKKSSAPPITFTLEDDSPNNQKYVIVKHENTTQNLILTTCNICQKKSPAVSVKKSLGYLPMKTPYL